MENYKAQFIEYVIKHQALKFGEFQLKSGRISPYFFNIGVFHTGDALAQLGEFYAAAISQSDLNYDMLFGPAYKGIPLVCTTAIALAQKYQKKVPYAFNRKEIKDHGEGGNIIGAPLQGGVLIIDDVITAGTAINDAMQIIDKSAAKLAGIVIALDRQERGQKDRSAIQEISARYNTKVVSIIQLHDIINYLSENTREKKTLERIKNYQRQYGADSS